MKKERGVCLQLDGGVYCADKLNGCGKRKRVCLSLDDGVYGEDEIKGCGKMKRGVSST